MKIYYEESGHTLGKAFAKNLELLTEDGAFNYAGYLLADKNNTSIKVAKYSGTTRTDLIESNEYGHGMFSKATKQVIEQDCGREQNNHKNHVKRKTASQSMASHRLARGYH